MRKRLLIGTALLGACLPALAQESLLLGRVERITMLPPGAAACPAACPALSAKQPDGSVRVCVSNESGCQQTEFRIERVLLGNEATSLKTFQGRIGEWGRLDFPNTHEPILVHVDAGRVHWASTAERDGKLYIDAAGLERDTVAGVAVRSIAPDERGTIALDRLLGGTRAPR
ncbi:hypothetical protein HH212_03245 [Massilia forsythiae]|uniref:Secreted protein n=1 Tax=Massilia forsythiae TaxID=2728020 RepID=A0A7Z2ZR80_9BURK|nr:hypothetical protein [Massilia forsythiae]QJD99170.1 hypothetical protein HH212_03245 [Massilia forsythiae]